MFLRYASLLVPLALLLGGCRLSGFQVEPVATSVQRPSNVAVYLAVSDDGRPLTNLTAASFRLFEDGQPLDSAQVELELLPRELAAEHHTLLLVDKSFARSDADRKALADAIGGFATRLGDSQKVTSFGFDGSAELHPIEEVSPESLTTADPSRNLSGAIVLGLRRLDASLASAALPVRVGTLVIFTAGPDLARRVSPEELDAEIRRTRHHVLLVTAEEPQSHSLRRIGKSGVIGVRPGTPAPALEQAAGDVRALQNAHYLVAYCSPARGGIRTLEVEVTIPSSAGRPRTAVAELQFSADGFEPGCKSGDRPRFVVTLVSSERGTIPGIAHAQAAEAESPAEPQEKADKPRPRPKRRAGKARPAAKPEPTPADKPADKPSTAPPHPGEPPDFTP
jgi:hypothetical protein